MRVNSLWVSGSLLVAMAMMPWTGHAQSSAASDDKVEIGMMDGAAYRVDMPAKWNGVLVMYYHGYASDPVTFALDGKNEIGTGLSSAGFAVAQSGYSEGGWALDRAIPETEALRKYVIGKYGKPKATYVMGHSMGGMLTVETIESFPYDYDGALPLCGLLEPASWAIGRAGAVLAAFHYYYPGVLAGPEHVPADTPLGDEARARVLKALPSNPVGLAEIKALGHFKTDEDLADGIVFSTFVLRDAEQKAGGPLLDNANTIYYGGPDDNALNDGVRRYSASDVAIAYLRTWYTPSGLLLRPVLAVHTSYDPIIAPDSVALYADQVARMGYSHNFVQQYVKHDGHCNIDGTETMAAFRELLDWVATGNRPAGGALPIPAH